MSKKLRKLQDLSEEELLNLISDSGVKYSDSILKYQVEYFEPDHDVLHFLQINKIKEGNDKVLATLFYKYYKKWSENPLDYRRFTYFLNDFIPSEYKGGSKSFFINKTHMELFNNVNKPKRGPSLKVLRKRHELFREYINHYQLKSGRLYIKDIVLYNLYDKWVYTNNKNTFNFNSFIKFCKIYFNKPRFKKSNGFWFSMDKSIKQYLNDDLRELMNK